MRRKLKLTYFVAVIWNFSAFDYVVSFTHAVCLFSGSVTVLVLETAQGSCRLLGHGRGKEYTESLGKLKWDSLELRRKYLSWSYCAIFYWDIVTWTPTNFITS